MPARIDDTRIVQVTDLDRVRTLIVGIGALGGTIATRAAAAGMPVRLAMRTAESARAIRSSGLRVSGVGGPAAAA